MRTEILRAEHIFLNAYSMSGLKNFSMAIYSGEIVGITGMLGSGVALVAQVLAGRCHPDSGQIFFCDREVDLISVAQAQQKGIYEVCEKSFLLPCLTLEENICTGESTKGIQLKFPSQSQREKINNCLRILDIDLDLKRSVSDLSLSECHKVELVRACYRCAKVVIVDRITTEYTPQELETLRNILRTLTSRGTAVIVVDAEYERLNFLVDRMLVLRSGRIEAMLEKGEWNRMLVQKVEVGDVPIPRMDKLSFSLRCQEPLLSVRHITTKNFSDLSFDLASGEILGFWEEGTGINQKLYRFLCGTDKVLHGTAVLDGMEISFSGGYRNMISQGFGYVERFAKSIFPKLSFRENLTITSLERLSHGGKINRKLEQAVVSDLARKIQLPLAIAECRIDVSDMDIQFLVTIYRWILCQAKVIVFENLLAGSDVIMKNNMLRIANLIHQSGHGIIVFSSNEKALYEFCDRVYLLKNDRIVPVLKRDGE